jgi:phosphoadenosine phosphosulfate reductase
MPQLIKGGELVADRWTLRREASSPAEFAEGSSEIVPLPLWLAHRDALLARGDVGVWLAPGDDPAVLAADVGVLPVIAVDFPQFTDGRGYSIGRLLRDRHGYRGELRAVGDILRDQLFALAECGFDAFALRDDRDAAAALAGFDDFTGVYASTSRTPQPWFRRRAAQGAPAADRSDLDRRTDQAVAFLRQIAARHIPTVFASSFGAEDMVVIDLIARNALRIRIFTIDTGRLPEETHALIERTRDRYRLPIDIFTPDTRLLQSFVRAHGVNAFYRTTDLRKGCCAVRKTEPLKRALVAKGAWITGLRRAQSVSRQDVPLEEFDTVHGIPKFNPLADWSTDDVWGYLRANGVPYNALHDQGYPSIGCAPCTRAVKPGEDLRAGRWWWETAEHKECGLHVRPRSEAASGSDALPEAIPT